MASITNKIAKGAAWNGISQFGAQGVNFAVTLVLAALLAPTAFGLVGMVTVFTAFFSYLTEFGLTPSLIQKKEIDEIDEHTVFWATVGLSITFYTAVFFAAPLIASFYREPQLVHMVQVLFATFLFSPLVLVPEAILKKQLEYPTIAKAELIATGASGVVSVGMALAGFGVWSLVFQSIVRTICKGIVLWIKTGWRPRFIFSFHRLRELLSFGVMFTANNLLEYATENIDYLIIGRLLGARALGIYTLAFRISKYPFMKVWKVFGQMLFPAFAQIRGNKERLIRSYRKTDGIAVIVLVPLLLAVYFGIDSFVVAVIGDKWMGIQPIVRILVGYLFVFSFTVPDISILVALGGIRTVVFYRLIYLVALSGLGFIATRAFGGIGMAFAYASLSIVYAVIMKFAVVRELQFQNVTKLLPNWRVIIGVFFALLVAAFVSMVFDPGLLHLMVLVVAVCGVSLLQLTILGAVNLRDRSFDFDRLLAGRDRK